MKIQTSAENYLETILVLKAERGQVRAIDIVNALNFSKPSVSIAMKQLEENGYILRDEDGHITLTEKGAQIAETIYARHDVLEKILIHLGVPESIAKEDACKIEHDISNESFEALKAHCQQILKQTP